MASFIPWFINYWNLEISSHYEQKSGANESISTREVSDKAYLNLLETSITNNTSRLDFHNISFLLKLAPLGSPSLATIALLLFKNFCSNF